MVKHLSNSYRDYLCRGRIFLFQPRSYQSIFLLIWFLKLHKLHFKDFYMVLHCLYVCLSISLN